MTRWAAAVEYAGSAYVGWQRQPSQPSVQAALETGLSRVAAHPLRVTAAGRTDAGVHACGQVIHFDSEAQRSALSWVLGANSNLPGAISLCWVQAVPSDFHARHSAFGRRYRYVVHNRRARSALLDQRAVKVASALDEISMHAAAQTLLGLHDFSAFRAAGCQSRTPIRRLTDANVWRKDDFVVLDIRANAFLHHMVRNIVGTLIEIGLGRQPVTWVAELLAKRDRRLAATTAPACGLYFIGAEYPARFELPDPPIPWFPA